MRRFLITGGSGLVGGHVAQKAVRIGEVFATMHAHSFEMDDVQTLCMDLSNPDQIREQIRTLRPDAILHTAAWTDVDACESDPNLTDRINRQASVIIAEEAACLNCRFLALSSDMVFDGRKGRYKETDAANPPNVYGHSKLNAEHDIRVVCPRAIIVRLALVYGNPITGGRTFSQAIEEKLRKGESVILFEDQYRTPILVQNTADLLLELIQSDFTGLLHLGGPDRVNRMEFGRVLARAKGLPEDKLIPTSMSMLDLKVRRPLDASMDVSKARHILKTPLISIHEGIKSI